MRTMPIWLVALCACSQPAPRKPAPKPAPPPAPPAVERPAPGPVSYICRARDLDCGPSRGVAARVEVKGDHASLVRDMLTELLQCSGFDVATDSARVELRVTVKLEDAGQGMGSTAHIHFADGSIIAKAVDTEKKGYLFAETIDTHRGHRSAEQASAGTLRKVCEKAAQLLAPKLVEVAESLAPQSP